MDELIIKPDVKYASGWARFGAAILDGLLLGIPTTIIVFMFLGGFFHMTLQQYYIQQFLSLFIWLAYITLLESSTKQATIGKGALDLIVVDLQGERLTPGHAAFRYFCYILPAVPMLIVNVIYAEQAVAVMKSAMEILNHKAYSTIPAMPKNEYMAIKNWLSFVNYALYLIWFLPVFFTKQRTCVHDILSRTRVIRKPV